MPERARSTRGHTHAVDGLPLLYCKCTRAAIALLNVMNIPGQQVHTRLPRRTSPAKHGFQCSAETMPASASPGGSPGKRAERHGVARSI
eukprot:scaffold5918_cov124-Isochrysis_galbana.AAC.18